MLKIDKVNYQVTVDTKKKDGFALHNISFSLESGYIMGLLGRNGAGKSTLLRLIYGIERPDSGSIMWKGKDIITDSKAFRQEVAYIGEEGFFRYRSLKENVEMLGMFYDTFDFTLLDKYLIGFGLPENIVYQTYEELSSGQKQRFQLAFALAHKPKLLLLDEPTANLDSVFRMELMELLQELVAKEEISVILSTHIISDIDEIADFIGILKEGEMVLYDDRETVMEQYGQVQLEELLLSVTELANCETHTI